MANVWRRIQQLNGETLYTLNQNKPFDIVEVRADRVTFVPQEGKGTQRWATREQIEHICELISAGKNIDRKVIQELYPGD